MSVAETSDWNRCANIKRAMPRIPRMVSRVCVVDSVRVAAFAFHAVMAIVVATLLFTCRTQMYTNTGYHVMVVDWQV